MMEEFLIRMGIDPDDFTWKDIALCARIPEPEVFHSLADKSDNIKNQALAICAACPVREICLEEAIRNQEYGIWGGKTLDAGRIKDED